MVRHHPGRSGGHKQRGSRDIMFSVGDESDFTYPDFKFSITVNLYPKMHGLIVDPMLVTSA